MIRFSFHVLNLYQILFGINYHRGKEVFEQDDGDIKIEYSEVQIGLIFFLIDITWYHEPNNDINNGIQPS